MEEDESRLYKQISSPTRKFTFAACLFSHPELIHREQGNGYIMTHAKAGGHPTSIAESKTCEAAKPSQCLWDWRQTPHCSWSRMYKASPASWSDECCSGEWQCPASFAAEESICCRAG